MILKTWFILEANDELPFITSDNPGYFVSKNRIVENIIFNDMLIFYFPLTPYHCLLIHDWSNDNNLDDDKPLNYISTNSELIKIINFHNCSLSNEIILGNSEKAIRECSIEYRERTSSQNSST